MDIWHIVNILAHKNFENYFFTPPYCTCCIWRHQLKMTCGMRTGMLCLYVTEQNQQHVHGIREETWAVARGGLCNFCINVLLSCCCSRPCIWNFRVLYVQLYIISSKYMTLIVKSHCWGLVCFTLSSQSLVWLGGAVVRTLDLWFVDRRFNSRRSTTE